MERSYTVLEIDRMRSAIGEVEGDQTGAILQSYILAKADPNEVIALYGEKLSAAIRIHREQVEKANQERRRLELEDRQKEADRAKLEREHFEEVKKGWIAAGLVADPDAPARKRPWYAFWS